MEFEQFLQKFHDKIKKETLIQGTISQARNRSKDLKRVRLRTVELKGRLHLQFEYQYEETMQHKNILFEEVKPVFKQLFKDFRQLHAEFENSTVHIQISKKYKVRWTEERSKEKKQIQLLHNRRKNYLLDEHRTYPFLVRLGVQTKEGKIKAKHYDKFKQINRFIELIDDSLLHLPKDEEIRILDFGSGKSYLTFALYHYLHEEKGLNIKVTGLDLKKEVIKTCSKIAQDLNYEHLNFEIGNIHDYQGTDKIDMVVSLHACDTATDMALAQAVKWKAKVILSVPCCQHELRKQIRSDELKIMLKHGLIKERFSALATDSLRAELLTLVGYDTQLLEFISMEHTPKNTLIRAYFTGKSPNEREIADYKSFRNLLHARPFLEGQIADQIKGF